MRIIFFRDTPDFWAAVAIVLLLIIGIVVYQWLRPPAVKKLLADVRYQQAVAVYAAHFQGEDVTADNRARARAAAAEWLTNEHGMPPAEAGKNLRLAAAEFDKERSYEARHEALA